MKKYIIFLIIVFVVGLIYYLPSSLGYSFSESKAIHKVYPYSLKDVVFSKRFHNRKVDIVNNATSKHVLLIENKWGFLYRVQSDSTLVSIKPDELLSKTWSAHLTKNHKYETVFGVEAKSRNITRIIVTNEGMNSQLHTLEEIKKKSSIYIELPVVDTFALGYLLCRLKTQEVLCF